jgi:hypothetical protein
MTGRAPHLNRFSRAISRSGLSIYDPVDVSDPDLWIPTPELEALLESGLDWLRLGGLPLRTRSKVIKQRICRVLGYPVPASFKRTRPRFPGQLFDTYVQKSNNLQIWNEEIAPGRRYVLIRLSSNNVVERVKVVTGDRLALLDTTGTLTQKYQARFIPEKTTELVVSEDTENLRPLTGKRSPPVPPDIRPTDPPTAGTLLPISVIYNLLRALVGRVVRDAGREQERARGSELHRLICRQLGYRTFEDDGRFPDLRHQLLEVKLQTAPTIDLGLIRPDSKEVLDVPKVRQRRIRHCDVRYAVFYGSTDGKRLTLTHLCLSTGEALFTRCPQFRGKVLNKKLQIPLPGDFFDR